MRRLLLASLLVLLLPAGAEGAGYASLQASCTVKQVEDAPALSYRFCDDGVPPSGGRTPNPGGVAAIEVPAAYHRPGSPTGAPGDDGTIDGLPPAAGADAPTPSCSVPGAAPAASPPGTCTVALDVDVTMPATPAPPGGHPVIAMMHGCCSGNKRSWESTKLDGGGSEGWHYNNVWFAVRGYVVVTYTARGFVTQQNQGSTGETQINSSQYEINDFQSLIAQMADDDAARRAAGQPAFFDIDPQRVVATGGSYGGGFSWLALTDPLWTSPGGIDLRLAAAAPKYGWTDLAYSLTPTGRHFYDEGRLPAADGTDSGYDLVNRRPATAGIPIRTIIAALYAAGTTGVPPGNHATFPPAVDSAFRCTQTFYPPEAAGPLCSDFLDVVTPNFLRYNSAYLRNGFFARVAEDPAYRVPVFSAGTHTDPLFPPVEHHRMAERLRDAHPGYPIQEYFGDYQHFTANKRKEWSDLCGADRHVCTYEDQPGGDLNAKPNGLARTGIHTMLNRFIDHYARPAGNRNAPQPRFDSTASLQVCAPNASDAQPLDEPGDTFTAGSYAALTPGELELSFEGEQSTTSRVPANPHAAAAEPVAAGGGKCPVETGAAGAGVAVYESPPLPSPATMIGGGLVEARYDAQGGAAPGLQLNARLYDVAPDGSAALVDRGPHRVAGDVPSGTAVFQLHGNGWRFPAGHAIRLELTQDDDPYLKSSDTPSSLTLGAVGLTLPLRETTYGTAAGSSPGARDRVAPAARMLAPRAASDVSTTPRFRICWRGADAGSGVRTFRVQARRTSGRRPGEWRTVRGLGATRRTHAAFTGRFGATYAFRVRARDRAGNTGRWSVDRTVVPTRERARGARYRGGWRMVRRRGAFGRRVAVCAAGRRCAVTVRYRGRGVIGIGVRGPRAGRVRVTLDGRSRVVKLRRSKTRMRRRIFTVATRPGRHVLRVRVLRGAVALDGFAIRNRGRGG